MSSPSVKQWHNLLLTNGPDVPIEAAEAWLAEESGGNQCAIGDVPSGGGDPQEYGLSQLNAKDPENLAIATPQSLRGNGLCGTGPDRHGPNGYETQLRPMTEAEREIQVAAAIVHMRHCASKARGFLGNNSGWGMADFWRLAKCYHASSAVAKLFPNIEKQMGRKPTWAEFQDVAQRVSLIHGYGQKWLDTVFLNCNRVGNALLGKGNV